VNTPAAPASITDIEAAAEQAHHHLRHAEDHATAGNWRKAHAEAEAAQGLCRRLKEMLGSHTARSVT
jgi:hypothetical protein